MSNPEIEVFKVNDGAIKVRGRVEVSNRVKVDGRVQVHGHVKTCISGQVVQISGQTVIAIVSGLNVNVSGAIVQISGQTVITSISGQSVTIAGISISGVSVEISGDIVQISGQAVTTSVSGNIVQISGNVVQIATPSEVLTGAVGANPLAVTTASGGVAVSSGVIVSVVLKSLSTNSGDMYVGGRSSYLPFSGYGYILSKGDTLMFDIDNFNKVFVVATVSGDIISFMGID